MKVSKIDDKFYQEIDKTEIEKELNQKIQMLESINFDNLEADYKLRVEELTKYKETLENEISSLEKLLNQ
mgnify:CR=1 FL=1